MAAWIYPTAPSGAIVTRDEDIFEPNGHGLNLRDGQDRVRLVTKWVDEGIRLRTEKADQPEPVASRGADLHWLALGERRQDLRRRRGSEAGDPHRRLQQPGRREAGAAPDRRRRRAGEPVPRQYRRCADLQAGAVAGGGRDARRPHAGHGDRGAAGGQADAGAGRQDPRLLPRARAAGQHRGSPHAVDGRPDKTRRVLSKPSHRHGDGGDAGAARDAPADPRDVRQTR